MWQKLFKQTSLLIRRMEKLSSRKCDSTGVKLTSFMHGRH